MKKFKSQEGVAAVEFALVLPLLVLLAFGIIEFSLVLFDKAVITNASREGARAGILYRVPFSTDPTAIVNNAVQSYCAPNGVSRLISLRSSTAQPAVELVAPLPAASGDPLTVRVTYRYNFLILPEFVAGLGGGINLQAETVMRME